MNRQTFSPHYPALHSDELHAQFLRLLPRIELHARFSFRHVKCYHQREDAIAETLALAWKWFCRLTERGKCVADFTSAFASFAVRAVKSGRRLVGRSKANDAASNAASKKQGSTFDDTQTASTLSTTVFADALKDNTRTPTDEQAAFRIDWEQWLSAKNASEQQLIHDLMVGIPPHRIARRFGVSSSRVSQLRKELYADWQRYRNKDTPMDDTDLN